MKRYDGIGCSSWMGIWRSFGEDEDMSYRTVQASIGKERGGKTLESYGNKLSFLLMYSSNAIITKHLDSTI